MRMKKFILSLSSIVLFCCIGCVGPKSCEAYAQCDELYMDDYNCNLPQRNIYTPTYNTYRSYYPNTQTIYYIPVPTPCPTPITPSPTESRPRPTRTGPRPGGVVRNTNKSD